jgi:hypothetical protein
MGGALGGVFSNQGQGADGSPSLLQSLVQGSAQGAGTAFGKGAQQPPPRSGGPGGAMQAPAATPVDPRFFQPSTFTPPGAPAPGGGNPAFYGQ